MLISDFIVKNNLDVLAVTETWLTPEVSDDAVQIENYCT